MRKQLVMALLLLCSTLSFAQTWNDPHQPRHNNNVRYAAFATPPKTLDPARAYSSGELLFMEQIYEPPLQYDYFKRPYTLVPLVAQAMPEITYYNQQGHVVSTSSNSSDIAYTVYTIHIKPDVYYQQHPAFAKTARGQWRYRQLTQAQIESKRSLDDFTYTSTRELTADDYIYEIKRLADPRLNSPIYGLMSKYIQGLNDLASTLKKAELQASKDKQSFIDLRKYSLSGVKKVDRYTYQITLKGVYPQFTYWLAMPFFAPIPWEADAFYSQAGMSENNIGFDWYPIGTGPYTLVENNPNKQMILKRNPEFRGEVFPSNGSEEDAAKGYMQDVGQQIPFVDEIVFELEREGIPRWNKFLQGYYDYSGITADSFDQAVKIDAKGQPVLTDTLKNKGIRLQTTVNPSDFYMGFNMLDKVVGGYSAKAKDLRQAISIALDYEEYISIFMNGRGIAAQGPIPPTIFGYESGRAGMNTVVYQWEEGHAERKSLAKAKALMVAAGYPGGVDPKTHKALILHYDAPVGSGPDDKARLNWMRKQFAKLGIQLNIRATQYNRFRDKVRTGNAQIFTWGWLADYPDPENFLFLLYGPNGKVKFGGENAANYSNPTVDALFDQIKTMPNSAQRQDKINQLLAIVRDDAPWVWGVHPIDFTLSHQWNDPMKPNAMARNTLKYQRIHPSLRETLRHQWNAPTWWPLLAVILLLLLGIVPLIIGYFKKENQSMIKRFKD